MTTKRKTFITRLLSYRSIVFFAASFFFLYLFIATYVGHEHRYYFWDNGFYYEKYVELPWFLEHGSKFGMVHMLSPDITYDYTNIPIYPLIPFRFAFGDSRLTYILSSVFLYAFPFLVLVYVYIRRLFIAHGKQLSVVDTISIVCALCVMPQFWFPIIEGELVIFGLLVGAVVLIFIQAHPLRSMKITHIIWLAVLCALMFLIERWFGFWIVGFIVSLGVVRLLEYVRQSRSTLNGFIADIMKLFGIAVGTMVVLYLVGGDSVRHKVLVNYADIYSAYRQGDALIGLAQQLVAAYGWLFWVGIVCSFVFLWRRGFKKTLVFHGILLVVPITLFSLIQVPNIRQQYLLYPSLIVLICLSFVEMERRCKPPLRYGIFVIGIAMLLIYFFRFYSGTLLRGGSWNDMLPHESYPPAQRTDFGTMERLFDRMSIEAKINGGSVYTLASSYIINSSIIANYCFQTHKTMCDRFVSTSDVDKRDGFSPNFFTATYVLVGNPIQYHLAAEDQRVVGVLAKNLLEGNGIGAAYEKIDSVYPFDGNVRVEIYKKVYPFAKEDLNKLADDFRSWYPDHKEKFYIPDTVLFQAK